MENNTYLRLITEENDIISKIERYALCGVKDKIQLEGGSLIESLKKKKIEIQDELNRLNTKICVKIDEKPEDKVAETTKVEVKYLKLPYYNVTTGTYVNTEDELKRLNEKVDIKTNEEVNIRESVKDTTNDNIDKYENKAEIFTGLYKMSFHDVMKLALPSITIIEGKSNTKRHLTQEVPFNFTFTYNMRDQKEYGPLYRPSISASMVEFLKNRCYTANGFYNTLYYHIIPSSSSSSHKGYVDDIIHINISCTFVRDITRYLEDMKKEGIESHIIKENDEKNETKDELNQLKIDEEVKPEKPVEEDMLKKSVLLSYSKIFDKCLIVPPTVLSDCNQDTKKYTSTLPVVVKFESEDGIKKEITINATVDYIRCDRSFDLLSTKDIPLIEKDIKSNDSIIKTVSLPVVPTITPVITKKDNLIKRDALIKNYYAYHKLDYDVIRSIMNELESASLKGEPYITIPFRKYLELDENKEAYMKYFEKEGFEFSMVRIALGGFPNEIQQGSYTIRYISECDAV